MTRIGCLSVLSGFVCFATLYLLVSDRARAEEPQAAVKTTRGQGRYPTATLPAAQGEEGDLAKLRGHAATVIVALSVDCPISQAYIPTLNRFAADFRERGVALVAINPNHGQTLAETQAFVGDFQPKFPVLQDADGNVARQLHLTVCPEVCLIDRAGEVRYRGRIDDRYARRGGVKKEIFTADLEQAVRAVLAGEAVANPRTKAVGCPVQTAPVENVRTDAAASVTYNKHIATILQKRCQECHRPGGIGPFSLTSYDQAINWAQDIREFTASGAMPPWKPVAGHGDFKNRRDMPQEERETIAHWVAAGCPEGRADDRPAPREFPSGWRLGEPDLVLTPSESYQLAADGADVYRCFVLPTDFDRDQYVVALEVLPGNARVVHHVIAFLDTSGQAERLDARDPGPGYSSSQGFPGFFPVGGLGGWAPGNLGGVLPEGMAKILPRGASVVMQVHYHKDGKPETDQTRLGLHFAKSKVTRPVFGIPVMPPGGPFSGMTIPAGEANHEIRCGFLLPHDMLAVCISPHMHLLGKDMRVDATLPDGRTRPLVYLKDWDFNWQEMYWFREPVDLPAGTRIDLVAHFDNSAANPRNPLHPPQTVRWGEQTTDEMCIAFVEMAPKREAADESELRLPDRASAMRYLMRNQRHGDGSTPQFTDAWKKLSGRMMSLFGEDSENSQK